MQFTLFYYFLCISFNISMLLFRDSIIKSSYQRNLRSREKRYFIQHNSDMNFDNNEHPEFDYDEYIIFVKNYQINNLNFSNEYEYFLAMNQNTSSKL